MTRLLSIALVLVLASACTGSCDAATFSAGLRAGEGMAGLAPMGTITTPEVTCGSALLDGGPGADGGYTVQAIGAGAGCYRVTVNNTGGQAVFLGGSTVQPDNGLPVCKTTADAGTCASQEFRSEIRCGALYCTATSALDETDGLRVLLEAP